MRLHHTKHHQNYVNGLNAAEEAYAKADSTVEKISLQSALQFNGGGLDLCSYITFFVFMPCFNETLMFFFSVIGHINHSLFWTNLAPVKAGGGQLSSGPLEKALIRDFGSVEEFKKVFNETTAAIQGSGWGWLVRFSNYVFSYGKTYVYMGLGIRKILQETPDCDYC